MFIEAEAARKWEDKEALLGGAAGAATENVHGKRGPGRPAPQREGGGRGEENGGFVCAALADHGRPAWQHGAPRLHSTTWSLPETQPPPGWGPAVWLGREAPGTLEIVNSRIVGLESRFQGHALGRVSGWWVGRGGNRPGGVQPPGTCEVIWKNPRPLRKVVTCSPNVTLASRLCSCKNPVGVAPHLVGCPLSAWMTQQPPALLCHPGPCT